MMPTEQGLPPGTCSEVALLFRAMSSCDLGQLAESCTSDLNTLFPGGNFGARAAIFAVVSRASLCRMYDSRIQAVLRNVLGKMELPLCWISHAEYLCGIKCEVEQLETVQLERGASTESDRRGVKVTAASACYGACGGVMGVVGLWGGAVIPLGIATTAGSLGFGVGSAVVLAAGTAIIMVATPVVLFTVGSLGALYGGIKELRKTSSIKTFQFKVIPPQTAFPPQNCAGLRLSIPGYILPNQDNLDTWQPTSSVRCTCRQSRQIPEQEICSLAYLLDWEPHRLRELGLILHTLENNQAVRSKMTSLITSHSLVCKYAVSALKVATSILTKINLDDPWKSVMSRAKRAAPILAEVIQFHLSRYSPVTLIGASAGTYMILRALAILADRVGPAWVRSVVADVILMGSPVPSSSRLWARARACVAGRVVNAMSRHDLSLSLFTAKVIKAKHNHSDENENHSGDRRDDNNNKVAGLTGATTEGVEDFDATAYVHGHMEYLDNLEKLMAQLGV